MRFWGMQSRFADRLKGGRQNLEVEAVGLSSSIVPNERWKLILWPS